MVKACKIIVVLKLFILILVLIYALDVFCVFVSRDTATEKTIFIDNLNYNMQLLGIKQHSKSALLWPDLQVLETLKLQ